MEPSNFTDLDVNKVKDACAPRIAVLAFVGCYLPGFKGGGPIRSIANMVDRLGDEFDFRIVTMDRDLGELHPYRSIKVDAWNQVGKAQVFYASTASRSLRGITRLMRATPHDVLYLNSFFSAAFTLKPLIARGLGLVPRVGLVVAPRGELSHGAFKLKHWKKFPFTQLMRRIGLLDDVRWHASTDFEAADIRRVIGVNSSNINTALNVACDLTAASNIPTKNMAVGEDERSAAHPYALRICFLSRIAPMKNLEHALKVLAQVKASVQFNIYGPKELPAYWAECELLIEQLPSNITVSYGGSVENSQVRSVIAEHDLFFVPSRGENFGHVFMEALSVGVPILVSDRTPWRDLEARKLGWDIPLDQSAKFVRAVEEAAVFDAVKRAEMRAHCIDFARERAEDSEALDMNRNLFLNAISSNNSNLVQHK